MQGIANRTKVHQNKYAFAHNPNSKKSARIMGIPNVGLCQRCHDIIEWRKKFRKFKPIKNPTKCACCSEKKVLSAYHNWCTDCARATNVCPKCLLNREILVAESATLTQESITEMFQQVGMKERVRRRLWRLWENDKVTEAELKEMIFNYNPDAKDEPEAGDDEEEEKMGAAAASSSSSTAAAQAAARGPPPKPKAAAPKPAAAAQPAAAKAAQENGEDDDEEDEDFEDDDEEDEEAAAAAAELARQQAAKRGPAPKPKQAAPKPAVAAAAISTSASTGETGLEAAVAGASINPTS